MAKTKKKLVPDVESPAAIKASPQDMFRRSMAELLDRLKEYNKVRPTWESYKAFISPGDFMMELYYAFRSATPGSNFTPVAQWLIDQMADKIEELTIDIPADGCYTNKTKLKEYPQAYRLMPIQAAPQPPVGWVAAAQEDVFLPLPDEEPGNQEPPQLEVRNRL